MPDTFNNPGPNTRTCLQCGNHWYAARLRILYKAEGFTLASDNPYELISPVCDITLAGYDAISYNHPVFTKP